MVEGVKEGISNGDGAGWRTPEIHQAAGAGWGAPENHQVNGAGWEGHSDRQKDDTLVEVCAKAGLLLVVTADAECLVSFYLAGLYEFSL